MNDDCWKLSKNLIPHSYVKQAEDASKSRQKLVRELLHHQKIPIKGWDDLTIESLLLQLSSMDSNNFPSNCGIGEREGRFASNLVARRHYKFSHGIGRSGDLTEPQPKAAGSSLMYGLTNLLLNDLMKLMGIQSSIECLVMPVATGMALVFSMLALSEVRPIAKFVIWSRIDQKSCFKSILTAGFHPIVVDTLKEGEELITDMLMLENKIQEVGSENVLCVMSTTSCFAPRACDNIENIAKLCNKNQVPHLINNAYGLQSKYIMRRIQQAKNKGRVDLFVQSTDKNLMVPVGGSIIATFDKTLLEEVAKKYPGRASSSPIIDTFITILSLGKDGYEELANKRNDLFIYLQQKLKELAHNFNERVLDTPQNCISIAMTLNKIPKEKLTLLGSMLFWRNVSGTRVITTVESKRIESLNFEGWGSHCNNFSTPYLTAAASLGLEKNEVDLFMKRLGKVLREISNKKNVEIPTDFS